MYQVYEVETHGGARHGLGQVPSPIIPQVIKGVEKADGRDDPWNSSADGGDWEKKTINGHMLFDAFEPMRGTRGAADWMTQPAPVCIQMRFLQCVHVMQVTHLLRPYMILA
jgi:hypothetical protein